MYPVSQEQEHAVREGKRRRLAALALGRKSPSRESLRRLRNAKLQFNHELACERAEAEMPSLWDVR